MARRATSCEWDGPQATSLEDHYSAEGCVDRGVEAPFRGRDSQSRAKNAIARERAPQTRTDDIWPSASRRKATLKRRRLRNPKASKVKWETFVPLSAPHVPATRGPVFATLLPVDSFGLPEIQHRPCAGARSSARAGKVPNAMSADAWCAATCWAVDAVLQTGARRNQLHVKTSPDMVRF